MLGVEIVLWQANYNPHKIKTDIPLFLCLLKKHFFPVDSSAMVKLKTSILPYQWHCSPRFSGLFLSSLVNLFTQLFTYHNWLALFTKFPSKNRCVLGYIAMLHLYVMRFCLADLKWKQYPPNAMLSKKTCPNLRKKKKCLLWKAKTRRRN